MDSPYTDRQADFMREDLANDMAYTHIIEATKKRFEKQGRDFDAEFKEWEKKKGGRQCH